MLAGSDITIAEGRDGWLFLERYLDARPLDFVSDLSDWSRTTLPPLRSLMGSRHQRLRSRGIDAVLLVAPEKSSVYSDYLPAGIVPDLPTAAERLSAAFIEDGGRAVDVVGLLRAARGAVPIYSDVDSHWTSFAAYRVYRALLEEMPAHLGLIPVPFDAVRYRDRETYGDLGVHLQPERSGRIQQVVITGPDLVSMSDTFDDREYAFQQHVYAEGRGRALVIRDSFATFLAPFLSRTFAETTYIAPPSAMPDDLVEDLKPDVVIVQMAERALFYWPDALEDWSIRGWRDIYLESQSEHPARRQNRLTRQAMRDGDWSDARRKAEAAADLDPDGRFAGNLGECRLRDGDPGGALAALQAHPRHGDRYRITVEALALWETGRTSEALDALDHALSIQPDNARLMIQRAEWLMGLGRASEAATTLENAVRIVPGHHIAAQRLAEARRARDAAGGRLAIPS